MLMGGLGQNDTPTLGLPDFSQYLPSDPTGAYYAAGAAFVLWLLTKRKGGYRKTLAKEYEEAEKRARRKHPRTYERVKVR